MLIHVRADDEWKEADHPRDKEGKFATTAGATPGPVNVTEKVTGPLKAAGYKKLKSLSPEGYPQYYNAVTGGKVTIHPAEGGKKWSANYTSELPGKTTKHGSSGEALSKLLGVSAQKAIEANKAKENKSPIAAAAALSEWKPDVPAPLPTLNQPASTPLGKLKDLGYVHKKNVPGTAGFAYVLEKEGSKIKYDPISGEWVAESPGHLTKAGVGIENLKKLLSGQPLSGSEWSNTSKTVEANPAYVGAPSPTPKPVSVESATLKKLMAIAPQPDSTEKNALSKYTGSGYSELNDMLRDNPKTAGSNSTIKALDGYLAKGTFPEPITLYRKVGGGFAKTLKSIMHEGLSYVENGFISTSSHKETWHGELKMIIDVPAGAKGCAVKAFSNHSGENEVLLPRKTRMIVKSIDYENNMIHVEVDKEFGHQKDV